MLVTEQPDLVVVAWPWQHLPSQDIQLTMQMRNALIAIVRSLYTRKNQRKGATDEVPPLLHYDGFVTVDIYAPCARDVASGVSMLDESHLTVVTAGSHCSKST
jgi:hypothetical protein